MPSSWRPTGWGPLLEDHWIAISLRAGLYVVSLRTLETLAVQSGSAERVHAPITDDDTRGWLWLDTCNAVTLTEDLTQHVVDNVGAMWTRALGGALTPRTPTGIAAHPAPGPRSSRHGTAVALDAAGRLIVAGGELRTDSYVLAPGAIVCEPISAPRLTRGRAKAFATKGTVRHFADGALAELDGGKWKRIATFRAPTPSALGLLHDPVRDRWMLLTQPVRSEGPAELRWLSGKTFGPPATPLPGALYDALAQSRGTVLGYDPRTDELVHVVGRKAQRLALAEARAVLTKE